MQSRPLPKALIAWSSGKDSAWALHEARASGDFDIVGALTTVTDAFNRVSMHGVREELLRAQVDGRRPAGDHRAHSLSVPERNLRARDGQGDERGQGARRHPCHLRRPVPAKTSAPIARRSSRTSGLTPVFPLWLKPTAELAREMIAAGVEAHLSVVDLKKLPPAFAGRAFDDALLDDFPAGTDPCGENGEFHSFVSAGPMLSRKIPVRVGETVEREGFAFADLLPA